MDMALRMELGWLCCQSGCGCRSGTGSGHIWDGYGVEEGLVLSRELGLELLLGPGLRTGLRWLRMRAELEVSWAGDRTRDITGDSRG